jgi:hypothetical protein
MEGSVMTNKRNESSERKVVIGAFTDAPHVYVILEEIRGNEDPAQRVAYWAGSEGSFVDVHWAIEKTSISYVRQYNV